MSTKTIQEICEEFMRDPTRNPRTGRPIKPTGKVYKDLLVECTRRNMGALERGLNELVPRAVPLPPPVSSPPPSVPNDRVPVSARISPTPSTARVPTPIEPPSAPIEPPSVPRVPTSSRVAIGTPSVPRVPTPSVPRVPTPSRVAIGTPSTAPSRVAIGTPSTAPSRVAIGSPSIPRVPTPSIARVPTPSRVAIGTPSTTPPSRVATGAPSIPFAMPNTISVPRTPPPIQYSYKLPITPSVVSIKEKPKVLTVNEMMILDDSPELEYRIRDEKEKTVVHWGQRKLLLSEIQFLTLFMVPGVDTVVYAGAAPGTHVAYLKELFPSLTFHLYDPRDFDPILNSIPDVHVYQQLFLDEDAARWTGTPVYFISDIRTADYRQLEQAEHEETVMLVDMKMQADWVEIMQPVQSLLKFRLPYADRWPTPTYDYLAGDIFKQVWPPQSSSETRLVPEMPIRIVARDNKKYEDQLFYHNAVVREQTKFADPFTGKPTGGLSPPELTSDYDSMAEAQILIDYLNRFNPPATREKVVAMSREITDRLNAGKRRRRTIRGA